MSCCWKMFELYAQFKERKNLLKQVLTTSGKHDNINKSINCLKRMKNSEKQKNKKSC